MVLHYHPSTLTVRFSLIPILFPLCPEPLVDGRQVEKHHKKQQQQHTKKPNHHSMSSKSHDLPSVVLDMLPHLKITTTHYHNKRYQQKHQIYKSCLSLKHSFTGAARMSLYAKPVGQGHIKTPLSII